MRVWRWIVGTLIALYALQGLLAVVTTTGLKFGWVAGTGATQRLLPLAEATSALQLAAWWAAIVLFFVCAWRVVHRQRTLTLYGVAFVLDIGNWVIAKLGGIYDRIFTTAELKFDYVLLAILLMLGATIWFLESTPNKARA